jgi:hypothetical protein
MESKVLEPSAEDLQRIEAQRTWVRDHYELGARHRYDSVEGKLEVLEVILRNGWIESAETVKLQSLGIAFGDALAQRLGLSWVTVEDELGRDPALILKGTSIKVFPLTTISKRIERGEVVDVYELFDAACATVQRIKQDGA